MTRQLAATEWAGGRDGSTVRRSLASYGGFLPALLLLGLFFLVPLGIIVTYSFWQVENYNVVHHWTLDNYIYYFSVSTYVRSAWATLWMSGLATVITIALAFPFVYWLSRHVPRRLRPILVVLVIIPFWTSYLLRVYSWLTILGKDGVLNRFLQWIHLTD